MAFIVFSVPKPIKGSIFHFRSKKETKSKFVGLCNSHFERVELFRYFGTTVTHPNSVQEEIKNRLKSGNA